MRAIRRVCAVARTGFTRRSPLCRTERARWIVPQHTAFPGPIYEVQPACAPLRNAEHRTPITYDEDTHMFTQRRVRLRCVCHAEAAVKPVAFNKLPANLPDGHYYVGWNEEPRDSGRQSPLLVTTGRFAPGHDPSTWAAS